jgi:hypothetical protein
VRRSAGPFRRPERNLTVGPKVLIACEGKRTEPGYFHAIRITRRLSERQVVIVPHEGTDPPTIVRAVEEQRAELRRERRWDDEVDTAWAVFDDDDHQTHRPAQWNDALQRARDRNIRLVVSNPCFELWYLLHFQDQNGALTRQTAVQLLRQHVLEYEKATVLFPDPLQERTEQACQRAQQLLGRAARDELGDFSNPSTNVHLLVRHLLELSGGR